MKKRIIAFILTFTLLFLCVVPTFAAEKEEFLSDVSLVYANSVEKAKEKIKNTDWKLFEMDLNPDSDPLFDNGVYLIYKTTTDVEDAITDLRVMDMYGGYSDSNYEEQLKDSKEDYLELVSIVKVAIDEFKAHYEAGNEMALLAYRQMNFYKDVRVSEDSSETDLLMGDFFLSNPSDEALVQVLMEGNTFAVSNLIHLIAIGVSGTESQSLSSRIAKLYADKDKLTDELYYEAAKELDVQFEDIKSILIRYDATKDEFDLESEEISEEQYQFMTQVAPLAVMLEKIRLGERTLADMIKTRDYEIKDLYPVVAAFTEGQMSLITMGQLETVLKYNTPTKPIEELYELVESVEEELKNDEGEIVPVDVYFGVDRSIFDGSFAMTNAAFRQQALTGETWDMDAAEKAAHNFHFASIIILLSDAAMVATAKALVKIAIFMARRLLATNNVYKHLYQSKFVFFISKYIGDKMASIYGVAAAVMLVAWGLSEIGNYYYHFNPKYKIIPNVMIDVRETDLGDKYIKYTAAKVFGDEEKNADFNAYEGKEWNALYYTKDASAGNCLTPNFKHTSSDSTVQRRYQGISMFGESRAFNLNSHVYSKSAPAVYLSVRYSNTKKAAQDMPDVVGSLMIDGGLYALTAIGGVGVGVSCTVLTCYLVNKKTAKSKKTEIPEETPS